MSQNSWSALSTVAFVRVSLAWVRRTTPLSHSRMSERASVTTLDTATF